MNVFLNMRVKTFILFISVMLIILMGIYWFYIIEEVDDDHHYSVSQERFYETHEVENIPEDDENELFYEGFEDRLTLLDDGSYHDFEVDRISVPVINTLEYAETEKIPFVVWWTPFTKETAKIKKCWHGNCLFSNDQQFYNHSLTKAFLFYGTDFNENKLPLPRQDHHEWALLHEESPKNQPLFSFEETMQLFNHTATFKQESSYPITTQYVKSIDYIMKPLNYTVHEKNELKRKHGLASIVYVQSGCNPPSDRDVYVQELMKYIPIDSYGKCLHNKDLPKKLYTPMKMHNKAFIEYLQQYKFMISFENAICDDYMTEKLFRTFNVGAIPIYKGAPNVREWLPDAHSAIVVDDYTSPKDLAEFLLQLDDNDEEYNKYLRFKTTGIQNPKLLNTVSSRQWGVDTLYMMSFVTGFECHVCDRIHQNIKLKEEGKTMTRHRAEISHYGCPKPIKYDFPPLSGSDDWERDTWIWEYEEAAQRAKALRGRVFT